MNGLIRGIERDRLSNPQEDKNGETCREDKNIHILAVETEGTASMALAMSQKALVTLPKITSMAVSLACVRVSEQTFDYCTSPPPGIVIHSAVLSDAAAARGCLRLADDERLLVELACGVCIEAAIGDNVKQQQRRPGGLKRKRGSTGDEGYGDDHDDDSRVNQAAVDSLAPVVADSTFASDDEDVLLPQQLSRLRQLVPGLTADSRVVIIVCGGSNVTTGMVSQWREDLDSGWV